MKCVCGRNIKSLGMASHRRACPGAPKLKQQPPENWPFPIEPNPKTASRVGGQEHV